MFGDAIKGRPPVPPIPVQPRCSSKRWHLPFLRQQRIARYLRKQESYNKPLKHLKHHPNSQMKRIPPYTIGESNFGSVFFFRVYICLTFLDMIFTLVKCCSGTPTPHPPQKPFPIQGDLDLVLAAVQQEGMALEYASPELQVRNSRKMIP